jgi:acetyltransferase-like isoleucine patch superfamily enzyme
MEVTESKIKKYQRLVAGDYASVTQWILQELLVTFTSGIKGALGLFLRLKLYPMVFKGVSRGTAIGSDVTLRCPHQVRIAAGVIVDDFVQLIANSSRSVSIEIGEGTFLRSFAMLNSGPPDGYIRIGNNSGIGQSTVIYGNGGVQIGDNVMIAGQCFIVASSHRFDQADLPIKEQGHSAIGISIADNVWVGAGCKILDGVTIGEGSVIAANAVVNKDVAPATIVGGIPAKVIGPVDSAA